MGYFQTQTGRTLSILDCASLGQAPLEGSIKRSLPVGALAQPLSTDLWGLRTGQHLPDPWLQRTPAALSFASGHPLQGLVAPG